MNPKFQRILIVDDDKPYVQRLARALRDRGCTVVPVESAEEAVEAAMELQPQAAILDLKLPGASGLACLSDLHTIWPDMRILILTGYGSIATAMQAVRQGVWDYLTKPANADQILTALENDPASPQPESEACPSTLGRLEWEHIQRVLNDNHGNVTQTAAALGMHRRSLQRKLRKQPPNA